MITGDIRNDYRKISPTAKIPAYWRSLSDIPFSKEIAEAVGAEQTARQLLGDALLAVGKRSPVIFEVRYKSINHGLKKAGIDNVMELACGLSPRGLEIASRGGVYVGTDLPDMYAESSPITMEIASRMNISPANLHLQPANVLSKDEMEDAAAHFNGQRFAVCNEGLLPYLNMREKATMAENIHALLSSNRSCWITTDVAFKEIRGKIAATLGPEAKNILQSALRNITSQTERNITDNDYSSKSEAMKFYEVAGFEIEEYPMYSGDYAVSTASLIPDDIRENFISILSSAKSWILTPKG